MKELLKDLGFIPTDFNTNNAWGFGGGVGTSWKHKDGREVRVGLTYYRHMKASKFLTYHGPGFPRQDVNEKELIKILTAKP